MTTIQISEIPAAFRTRLREQIMAAENQRSNVSGANIQKNFLEFLGAHEKVDAFFLMTAKYYESKLGKIAIRFNQESKNIIEGRDTSDNARKNLLEFLFQDGRLFTEDYVCLFRDGSLDYVTGFIAKKDDDELALALKKLQFTDASLKPLAQALLKYRSLSKVETILRKAYGADEMNLKDVLTELNSWDIHAKTAPYVRRNLQALLVEVYREDLVEGKEFTNITNNYLNAETSSDRANWAQLLREKFSHEALEFFQNLAMHESKTNTSENSLEIRLEAIAEYARMKPVNLAETLWSIIAETKHPTVIFKTLTELAKLGKLSIEDIFNKIKNPESAEQGKIFLFTLLKLAKEPVESLFKTINSSAQDFFERLFKSIPALKDTLIALDNDFKLRELELDKNFTDHEINSNQGSFRQLLDKVLAALNIRVLIQSMLQGKTTIERNNAMNLLQEIPDNDMISFHRKQHCDSDKVAAQALTKAVGLEHYTGDTVNQDLSSLSLRCAPSQRTNRLEGLI